MTLSFYDKYAKEIDVGQYFVIYLGLKGLCLCRVEKQDAMEYIRSFTVPANSKVEYDFSDIKPSHEDELILCLIGISGKCKVTVYQPPTQERWIPPNDTTRTYFTQETSPYYAPSPRTLIAVHTSMNTKLVIENDLDEPVTVYIRFVGYRYKIQYVATKIKLYPEITYQYEGAVPKSIADELVRRYAEGRLPQIILGAIVE